LSLNHTICTEILFLSYQATDSVINFVLFEFYNSSIIEKWQMKVVTYESLSNSSFGLKKKITWISMPMKYTFHNSDIEIIFVCEKYIINYYR